MKGFGRFCHMLLLCAALLGLLCVGALASHEEEIPIDARYFPDERFRTHAVEDWDTNQDGVLSLEEREAVTALDVNFFGIETLAGIEYLPNLEELNCHGNFLTRLDISRNPRLTWLQCSYNELTALDVSTNRGLTHLYCYDNPQLKILDVTGLPLLEELDCSNTGLTELDVSKNPLLTMLVCGENQLTRLELKNNTLLDSLDCGFNPLESLDLSPLSVLTSLHCTNSQLKSLDLGPVAKLQFLACSGNELQTLDVSCLPLLESLICRNNMLTELDVSQNPKLDCLRCDHNQLTVLDLSHNPLIDILACGSNRLTSLDLRHYGVVGILEGDNNLQEISLDGKGQFDLTTLPGSFDPAKTSNWTGGTVENGILTASEELVTYTYACSSSHKLTFTLKTSAAAPVARIYGPTRYETAFQAADTLKEVLGVAQFDSIIVACGTNFPDALTGTYLAAQKNAPILLVKSSNVGDVNRYLAGNLKQGGTLYLLGTQDVVPEQVGRGIPGIRVERLGGDTRYDTNLRILEAAGMGDRELLVCSGKSFADSLSASATGLPILLVKDSLTGPQKAFLQTVTGKITIIGGLEAVSWELQKQLQSYGQVERVSGDTRYETSVKVARAYFPAPAGAVLAYGKNFPDGLSGGPLAHALGMPLVLTASGKEGNATAYGAEFTIRGGYVLGGPGLISDNMVRKIFAMAPDAPVPVK